LNYFSSKYFTFQDYYATDLGILTKDNSQDVNKVSLSKNITSDSLDFAFTRKLNTNDPKDNAIKVSKYNSLNCWFDCSDFKRIYMVTFKIKYRFLFFLF